jgi:hypothetical protein
MAQSAGSSKRARSHGREIGRFFGKGICPVIGSSLVLTDACASVARLRIAVAACWKAASFPFTLWRGSIFAGVPVSGLVLGRAVGGNRRSPSTGGGEVTK